MNPEEKIQKLIRKSEVTTDAQTDQRILNDAMRHLEQIKPQKTPVIRPNIWRIIMKSLITKLAAAAMLIVVLLISFHYFSISFENVAFADFIKKILNSSYTFDSTTIGDVDDSIKFHFAILLSVGCRIDMDDPSQGTSSTIIDFNTGDAIVLNHVNKIAITDFPESENTFVNGPFSMFLNPAERLWNMKDGTETQLGTKEIDGISVTGFKIEQVKENSICDIIIWANRKTAAPVRVELTLHDPENSHSVTFIMSNFNLNAELNKELFSTKPPQGYKVTTYQKIREDITSVYRQQ
jgi:outer membrane lipoprotein-sorting protein